MKTLIAAAALILACGAQAQNDGKNRQVKIINKTSEIMTKFYASRIGTDGWGKDRLGDQVLRRNYEIELNITDGSNACRFDLRAVFDNGEESTRFDFNVCTEVSITFRD
jgi:hypothetical protein